MLMNTKAMAGILAIPLAFVIISNTKIAID